MKTMSRALGLILLSIFALSALSCASKNVSTTGLELMSEREYGKVLDRSTRRIQKYNGLYNTVEISATLIRAEMAQAILEQSARLYQWDKAQFQLERNKRDESMKNETEIFMSFYTPDKKNDDLHKRNTQWRVYLETTEGRRWEGKVTKLKTPLAQIQGIYTYHNRFSSPYSVTFPVGTQTLKDQPAKLIVTGPVEMAVVSW